MKIEKFDNKNLQLIQNFYTRQGYMGVVKEEDIIIVAHDKKDIIGVVRISNEENTEMLRGMFVDKTWQKKGVGKKMLFALEKYTHGKEIYCLPFKYLVGFYGLIGFQTICTLEAPVFLQKRLEGYLSKDIKCIIMYRKSAQ